MGISLGWFLYLSEGLPYEIEDGVAFRQFEGEAGDDVGNHVVGNRGEAEVNLELSQ